MLIDLWQKMVRGKSRTPGRKQRQPGKGRLFFKPWLEILEDRVTPNRQKVAYLVAGLGGQIPDGYPQGIFPPALISSLQQNGFEVDLANWNSANYLVAPNPYNPSSLDFSNLSGDSGYINVEVNGSFTTPSFLGIPSLTIPTSIGFNVDIGSPTQDAFVEATVNRLKSFDSQDTIVLIGHSLGGCAVLTVAQELSKQAPAVHIALLGLLDPVGYAPSNLVVSSACGALSMPIPEIGGVPLPIAIKPINWVNGFSNADNETPGFRGFGGIQGPVPATVDYFYNRWQTNFPFPIDFWSDGRISSYAQFPDQGAQNTTDAYHVVNTQRWWDILGLFRQFDLLSGTSTAQQHDLPQNPTVDKKLEAIFPTLSPITPPVNTIPPTASITSTFANPASGTVSVAASATSPSGQSITEVSVFPRRQRGVFRLCGSVCLALGHHTSGERRAHDCGHRLRCVRLIWKQCSSDGHHQ